jgi:hypothetical protein
MVCGIRGSLEPRPPASAKRVERRRFEIGFHPHIPAIWKNARENDLLRGEERSKLDVCVCDLLSNELRASALLPEILESQSESLQASCNAIHDVYYFRYVC